MAIATLALVTARTTDNPPGSSRGEHNYPSPNAARTRTQAAANRCPTVAGSASAAGGAPSPHGRTRRAAADRARHGARRRPRCLRDRDSADLVRVKSDYTLTKVTKP
eukprot:scaffold20953_cov55-Phaeocystis_antarctica.AAC.2